MIYRMSHQPDNTTLLLEEFGALIRSYRYVCASRALPLWSESCFYHYQFSWSLARRVYRSLSVYIVFNSHTQITHEEKKTVHI